MSMVSINLALSYHSFSVSSHILSASSNSSLLISLSAHSIFAMNESVLPEINPVSTDAKHSAARTSESAM